MSPSAAVPIAAAILAALSRAASSPVRPLKNVFSLPSAKLKAAFLVPTAALAVCKAVSEESSKIVAKASPLNTGGPSFPIVSVNVKTASLSGVPSSVVKVIEPTPSIAASAASAEVIWFGPAAVSRPSPKVSKAAKVIELDGSSWPV